MSSSQTVFPGFPYKIRNLEMNILGMSLACTSGLGIHDQDLNYIPVVDFSNLNPHSKRRSLAVTELRHVCQTLGCFQVINHGIEGSIISGALEAASDFFNLPEDAKAEFASDDLSKPVRYGTNSKDGISKARDILKLYSHPLSDWFDLWPEAPQDYREKMGKYAIEARRVALQLIDAILESLGFDHSYLKDNFDKGLQVLVNNFYPQNVEPDTEVGLDAHSDHGFITILIQTSQGLQVMDRKAAWQQIPHIPEALHVHIGDHLEVLSNGRYKSLFHRAILNPEMKRISIASIQNLSMDEKVSPAIELVDELNPKLYRESSFRDFVNYLSTPKYRSNRSFIHDLKILGD